MDKLNHEHSILCKQGTQPNRSAVFIQRCKLESLHKTTQSTIIYIQDILVLNAYQRKGIGTKKGNRKKSDG